MIRRLALTALLFPSVLSAQSQQEFAMRRVALANRISDGAFIALSGREPEQDYLSFYQSPNFYYLTGFKEPDAALVMLRRGTRVTASLLVRPRQPNQEVWTGARIGVEGVSAATGLQGRSYGDLATLLDSLAAAGVPMTVVGDFGLHQDENPLTATRSPDEQIFDALQRKYPKLKVTPANDAVEQLRGTKSPAELSLIKQAVEITVRAQREAIAALKDGMNEFELQALIEYTFRRNGADRPSFATIVGSGPNATTLHYNADNRFIGINDMVVMDIGASFKGYAADVTRTVPASGHFSTTQRDIYQLVRDAQAAAERQATPGALSRLMNDSANAVIATGLAKYGLIESPGATYDCSIGPNPRQCPQYRMYYMHGLGHGIGLEVHDPEQYYYTSRLAPGSAFTIEPGIYVREHVFRDLPDTPRNRALIAHAQAAAAKYRNVGVRLEDDYVITGGKLRRITTAPREIDEIEALRRKAVVQ